jgi:hypothetical protein
MDPTGTDGGDTDQISSGLSPQNSAEGSEKGPLVDRRDYPPPKASGWGNQSRCWKRKDTVSNPQTKTTCSAPCAERSASGKGNPKDPAEPPNRHDIRGRPYGHRRL